MQFPTHEKRRTHGLLKSSCAFAVAAIALSSQAAQAGTWTQVANNAPGGVNLMELLTDGTVIAQNGGNAGWYKLTPDIHGSYVNGAWSSIASMHDTRLYGASQVMPDGRFFYAGAEYGTGGSTAEVYDPLANTWTTTPSAGQGFSDCISTTLPNGNVIVGPVSPSVYGGTVIFNDQTKTWSAGPTYVRGGYQDEASWVKLPDESVLTIDPFGTNSERLIPSQNRWVDDGIVPVAMYDSQGELGAAFLLPTGKAFFIGATGHTALYTPTGNTNPGSWAAGPDIPNGHGASDSSAAMMINGSILCAVGAPGSYSAPTYFYEYNPYTNSFTSVNGPTGVSDNVVPYGTKMLDLPDGSVMYANGGSTLYEYRPSGAQIASARPVITNVAHNVNGSYQLTGTLLTGISEGAAYGDDAQMATNYPIIRLTATNGNVYYARTYNWNDTGVMSTQNQSTQFTVPASVPSGSYTLQVVTNGIVSDPIPFPATDPYFMLVNQNSGKCLDLIGGNTANGAVTNQWSYDYNSTNQRWALQPTENGDHFKLISWVDGKAVSVSNDSTGAGAQLWAWDYNSDPSQQWDLVDVGNGWYNVRNVRSGLNMDVSGSSTADNAMIQQWTINTSGAQKWRLQPWGSYYIRAAGGPVHLRAGRG